MLVCARNTPNSLQHFKSLIDSLAELQRSNSKDGQISIARIAIVFFQTLRTADLIYSKRQSYFASQLTIPKDIKKQEGTPAKN